MKKWKIYLIAIIIPILVGGLTGILTANNMDIYSSINRPPLSPPSWLFPIVWSILYVLMGISSALYYINANAISKVYVFQLIINFIWPILFFNQRVYLLALIWLLLLIVLVILMIRDFYKVNKLSGLLQIPYLIWLLFATYLNFSIYLLN